MRQASDIKFGCKRVESDRGRPPFEISVGCNIECAFRDIPHPWISSGARVSCLDFRKRYVEKAAAAGRLLFSCN